MDELDCAKARWRIGRSVGRTIYAMHGPVSSDDDTLIGLMDTPALAKAAVEGHNLLIAYERERNGRWLEAGDTYRDD